MSRNVTAQPPDHPEFEGMEARLLLSASLPGMYLVDPSVDRFDGQAVYLDFNGERNVTYNGTVTVGPFDIPAFRAPDTLAGQELAITGKTLSAVNDLFANSGVSFTTQAPTSSPYSTVYVGGDSAPFASYGNFSGVAEEVDTGNTNPQDNAFVFSASLAASDLDTYVRDLSVLIGHETGHLLGYAHRNAIGGEGPLDAVAAVPNQPTFSSVPSAAKLYPYTYPNSPTDTNGPYLVTVDYTDPDGASDLQHVYLQLTGNGNPQTLMYYNMTTPQQWAGEGDHLYNISASKAAIANGYRVTWSFQVKGDWTPSTNIDFDAWTLDKSSQQSTHRAYDWNGIYDNNLVIFDARTTSLVDNDGDGYYSSVTVQADADTSVASRSVKLILYSRDSNAGGSGSAIWNTTYTTSGTSIDYQGTAVVANTRGVYDFAWELYDPTWYITNRWYDVDADISNIKMEPAAEDIANSPPSQPSFNSVPSPAKLYPYTYPDSPNDTNGPYTVVVDYTDPNGAADLQHTYLRLTGNGTSQTIMYSNLTSAAQWAGEGDNLYNISASKSAIANGYRVTYSFQIKGTWTPSTNVDFEAWALDKANAEGAHQTNDWNGIYDNNLVIADGRLINLVDNDGDGYYSSVTVQADANTSVASRSVDMKLYQRDSATGNSGWFVWDSGSYTTNGTTTDWKGATVTVNSRATYDFAWELYDPTWYITNRWYDVDADISNIKMEPASQDALRLLRHDVTSCS